MDEAKDTLRYDVWIEDALRAVVRRALVHAAERGLPGNHHFYITFSTGDRGVGLSGPLKVQYPEEMTIVLQHQFTSLKVDDDGFEVTLRFGGKPERLAIPFASVTAFHDPSVNFGLQLKMAAGGGEEAPAKAAAGHARAGPPAAKEAEAGEPAKAEKVVTLDAFRKK